MLTLFFIVLLVSFVLRMIALAVRLAWGLSGILLRIVFFPLALVLLAFSGLIRIGIIVLIIAGIASLFNRAV